MAEQKPPNHLKTLRRLRLDPKYIAIQEKAIADQDNIQKYVEEVIKEFKLSTDWRSHLSGYLLNMKLEIPLTGAMIESYNNPFTQRESFTIVVDPETTKNNVIHAYKAIMERYKEDGRQFAIRQSDNTKTAIELRAYRLKQAKHSNSEILNFLEQEFPKGYHTLSDIPLYIQAGKEKLKSIG